MIKKCLQCKKNMLYAKANQFYCSNNCRTKAYRARNGVAAPAWLQNKIKYNRTPEIDMAIEKLSIELKSLEQLKNEFIPTYQKVINEMHKFNLDSMVIGLINSTKGTAQFGKTIPPHKYDANETEDKLWFKNKQTYFKETTKIYDNFNEKIIELRNQITKLHDSTIVKAEKETSKRNKDIVSGRELSKEVFPKYDFEGKFSYILGQPGNPFCGLVWGDAKSGKSSFTVELSQYLTQFGKVLYWSCEEGNSMTLQNKIDTFKAYDTHFFNERNLLKIKTKLWEYDFLIIDSVTIMDLEPEDVEDIRQTNSQLSVISVLQSTKGGLNFKGSQNWAHNSDFNLSVDRIDNKINYICDGRFGNFDYTITI